MIVHYNTGKSFIMPISGRHTICACGKSFQDNYEKDKNRHTSSWNMVTCKKCLRFYLKKYNAQVVASHQPATIDVSPDCWNNGAKIEVGKCKDFSGKFMFPEENKDLN